MLVVTEAMNSESANKFISALVKALQTLCHGYVEFNDGIEIIGHIYLNIDSGSSFDYVVKEKLCKNAENSTVFVSKSFQALAPSDECLPRKDRDDEHTAFEDASMSPTSGTSRLQSAITSISNVLSGVHENIKPRIMEHSSHHPTLQNTGKRKREHNGNYSSMQPPLKYTTLQTSSSSSSSSVYFGSGQSSKHAANRNHAEHFSNDSHAEFFGGDSNQGPDDEDDLHLDVTFVKEEYESQRNSVQRGGVSGSAASRLSQDLSSNSSSLLHDGNSGSAATLGYSSSHHQVPQQFASGTAGNMGGLNPAFQDTSQGDLDQQGGPRPPNPRNDASAGPPVRMPEGVKPLCGYVHPDDAKKWMMFELLPGSGVYIHQENYSVVLSKTRQDRPDGKAMARYLMSCFWRQSELVGASIAEPPKPHQRSLDRGIIHSILVILDVTDMDSMGEHPESDNSKPPSTDEQRLLKALIWNYDPAVRPVYDARHSVVIKLGITLTQIIDMDEKNQVLTTNIWLDQEWRDEKLEWNLSDYNNISVLRVPCDFIWLPDIVLYNSVDNHNKGYMKSLAMVHSDGNVFWPPIVRMRSSCKMDITYFPFDDQLCGLILGSWAYDGLQVDVTNRSENVDLSNYVDSGEWELLDTKIIRRVKYYTCCPEPYIDVTFYIMIRRRVLYYFLNVIIPCMLLSSLSLTGFLLPPDAGEKVTLGLTVLLAFSVFMLLVAENMPPTSEYVPLIGIYLTVIMAMSAMSVALSVFVLNCHHRGTRLNRPPKLVRVFAKIAAKCFCVRLTYLNKRKDTSSYFNQRTNIPSSKNNAASNVLRTQATMNQPWQNMPSDTSRDSHLASSASTSVQSNPGQRSPSVDNAARNGAAGSHHTRDHAAYKREKARTRSMVELQMLQYLQAVLEAYTKEREDRVFVLEWQEVARVLDKFFFWIFVIVTTVITIFLLMLSPIAKQIEFPNE